MGVCLPVLPGRSLAPPLPAYKRGVPGTHLDVSSTVTVELDPTV